MQIKINLWIVAVLLWAGLPAEAGTLFLKDGRVFDGLELTRGTEGVSMTFENGDITVPWEMIQECIIPGDDGYTPENDEDRAKIEQGFVRYKGKWIRPSQREKAIAKLVEEQKSAVEELKEYRLWRNRRTEETKNFIFEYTVPQHVFEGYRDLMETYFKVFAKDWKIKRPKGVGKLNVKFFVDYEAFVETSGASRGTLGFFKFVEPYELAIFYDRLDPRGTEEVIYHEVGHYLQKLVNVDFKYPHWPGESLSEYYSGSNWDPETKTLTTGDVMESRLSGIQLGIKNNEWVGLEEMLLRAPERTYTDYSWGWSFVHYLMNNPKHAKNFTKFYKALSKDNKIERTQRQYTSTTYLKEVSGEEVKRAFMRIMKLKKDEDLKALETEWYDYLQNDLEVTTTRGLEAAAWHSKGLGRKHRAKRLFEDAFAAGDASAQAHYRYAELATQMDEEKEAEPHYAKALELDPLATEYYIDYGEFLLGNDANAKKDEGKRLLKLAFELEPDNFYLERNIKRLLKD